MCRMCLIFLMFRVCRLSAEMTGLGFVYQGTLPIFALLFHCLNSPAANGRRRAVRMMTRWTHTRTCERTMSARGRCMEGRSSVAVEDGRGCGEREARGGRLWLYEEMDGRTTSWEERRTSSRRWTDGRRFVDAPRRVEGIRCVVP